MPLIEALLLKSQAVPSGAGKFRYAWGTNQQGQVGNGTSGDIQTPTQVGTSTTWVGIQGESPKYSDSTNVALRRSDNTLWTWGSGTSGGLGLNSTSNQSSPTQVGTAQWARVSYGGIFCAAVRTDGTLWTWGSNSVGQLGLNNVTNQSSPVQVGTATDWELVSCAFRQCFAIKTGGSLWAWGNGENGTLGLNTTTSRSSPTQVGTATDWDIIYAGGQQGGAYCLAIKTTGSMWSWGRNAGGNLGQNNLNSLSSPTQIGTDTDWLRVAAGAVLGAGDGGLSAAIKTNGTLWTWGRGINGNLGLNSTTSRSSPTQVGTATDWYKVECLTDFTYVTKTNGTLWRMGNTNVYNGDPLQIQAFSSPTQLGTTTDWDFVSHGGQFLTTQRVVSLKTGGSLWTWGSGDNGVLGQNLFNVNSPTQVGTTAEWLNVATGRDVTVAIKDDNTLWSNGVGGTSGALGTNFAQFQYQVTSPVQIGTDTDWTVCASGQDYCGAINQGGELYMWGADTNGKLGLNGSGSRSSPTQVGAGTDWSQLKLADSVSAAIKTNGTLWMWGANGFGELGDGTVTTRSSPVQIGTDTNWSVVNIAVTRTSMALRTNGTIWAWGLGSSGALGQNNETDRSSPIQIGTDTDWTHIAAKNGGGVAIKTNGTAWVWGSNLFGALGLGNETNRSSPVQLGTDTDWDWAWGSNAMIILKKTNGTLWATGRNQNGQLGLGDFTNRSSPVQIGSLGGWTNITNNIQLQNTQMLKD